MKLLLVLAAILVLGKAEWDDVKADSDAALKTVEQREERLLSLLLNKVVQHLRADTDDSRCLEPEQDPGCDGYFNRMFFFNTKTLMCESNIWGGCQAIGNNFETFEDCMRTCREVRRSRLD